VTLETDQTSPRCALYLITPPLTAADAPAFARNFAEALKAAPVACALVRFAAGSEAHGEAIAAPLLAHAKGADCALLIENDPHLAARLRADGVHIAGVGPELADAVKRLKPDRIVGAGSLPTRDDAMNAGEMGADYVMFGEARGGARSAGFASLVSLTDRVVWWSEIFETPCVAFADTIEAASELADAGADFVALGDSIWGAPDPAVAVRKAHRAIARVGIAAP
jgi:thiamine-phosphate pyrophosphorylase